MTFSLQSLLTKTSRDEFLQLMLDTASAVGLSVTAWQDGQWTKTILTLVGQVASDLSEVIVEPIRGGFGDLLSSTDWANAWAKGQFDVDRNPATSATTDTYQIINPTGTPYSLNPGDLIVAHSVTGKTYRNTASVTVAASATTVCTIAAVEPGSASNAAPNSITQLVAPAMPSVTVNNPASAIGADEETTPNLITRSRSKLASFSPNGPKAAYDYVVTTPTLNPTSVPITRGKTSVNQATGDITEYIATSAGAPSGGDVTISTTSIQKYTEPWGANAVAAPATNHSVAVTYEVWVKGSTLTETQIKDAISAALSVYFSTIPIGGDVIPPAAGKVFRNSLVVVIATSTAGITQVGITLPATDETILASEVPVLGTVTGTVIFLPS